MSIPFFSPARQLPRTRNPHILTATSIYSPEDAKWLSEEERSYLKARLEADQGKNAHERSITFRDVVSILRDPKVLIGGIMYMGLVV